MDFINFLISLFLALCYLPLLWQVVYFFLLFLIFTVFFKFMSKSIILHKESMSWPHTKGRILQSKVDLVGGSDPDSNVWVPLIEYEYFIHGQRYTSRQISIGGISSYLFKGPIENIVNKYPKGKKITVYYNPKKPEFSILEHSEKHIIFGLLKVILLVLIVLFFVTIVFLGFFSTGPFRFNR